MKIISVANVAARVGKTTISISLAAELALRGFRTLLIDADPQARATSCLLPAGAPYASLTDVLCRPRRKSSVRPIYLWDALTPTPINTLSFIPANLGLMTFEGLKNPPPLIMLEAVVVLNSLYEFAIIDTPPSLGNITQSCLRASTRVLAPIAPRTQAKEGLKLISKHITEKASVDPPDLLGVCNFFDCRERASGEFVEEVRRECGTLICETLLHRDKRIEEYAEQHQIIQTVAPTSTAATLFTELADELLAHLNITGPPVVASL